MWPAQIRISQNHSGADIAYAQVCYNFKQRLQKEHFQISMGNREKNMVDIY